MPSLNVATSVINTIRNGKEYYDQILFSLSGLGMNLKDRKDSHGVLPFLHAFMSFSKPSIMGSNLQVAEGKL